MTLAAFTGHEVLTFTDYLDLETGKTLRAEPGGVYDVASASGRVVPEVPEPWFTRVYQTPADSTEVAEVQVEPVAAPESAEMAEPGEPDAEPGSGEPETDFPREF